MSNSIIYWAGDNSFYRPLSFRCNFFVQKNSFFSKSSITDKLWWYQYWLHHFNFELSLCALFYQQGLEYGDCILCKRVRCPPLPKKSGVLDMTLNCIRCWGSSSRDLGSVEYSFHYHYSTGLFWPRVVIPVGVSSMSQTGLFKNYSYSIRQYAKKKTLYKQLHKKCNYEHTMNVIP